MHGMDFGEKCFMYLEQEHKIAVRAEKVRGLFDALDSRFRAELNVFRAEKSNSHLISKTSLVFCLFNAKNNTLWNVRRELLLLNDGEDFLKHLQVNNLAMTIFVKSEEVWHFRKWVFGTFKDKIDALDADKRRELLENELVIAEKGFVNYPRNYYAWCYRMFIVQTNKDLAAQEFLWSERFIRKYLKDHCAVHYRQFLLSTFFADDRTKLEEDFFLFRNLIRNFPGNTSLWSHMAFLGSKLLTAKDLDPVIDDDREDLLDSVGCSMERIREAGLRFEDNDLFAFLATCSTDDSIFEFDKQSKCAGKCRSLLI